MDIKLTRAQYETLMRLVYLGNWVVNGFRDKDKDPDTDALENYIYAKARDFGLGDRIIYDEEADAHFPTESQEERVAGRSGRLQERPLLGRADVPPGRPRPGGPLRRGQRRRHAPPSERKRMEDELADQYYKEFEKNGLDNLQLVRPS